MGTWSEEPFGNDTAADWAWELDGETDWHLIEDAFNDALGSTEPLDADVAAIAIAAAETVARGLGRATQDDAYTESIVAFVSRAGTPPEDLVRSAVAALSAASGSSSELTELWDESGTEPWEAANARIMAALTAPRDSA